MSSGDRRLCNTCNIWISTHPANVARHEVSEIHKMNIRKKIREADDIRKKQLAAESAAKEELVRITRLAEASSAPKPALMHLSDEMSVQRNQSESVWIVCRTEAGRVYYANRMTGTSQWHKPQELGGIEEPIPEKPSGPPKPKTGSLPPPRPKTSSLGLTAKTKPPAASSELLDSLIVSKEDVDQPSFTADPSTGFGEWEEVERSQEIVESTLEALPRREVKRPLTDSSISVSFNRTVTKKIRRVTRED